MKKVKKECIQEAISLLSLPVIPDASIHMLRGVRQVIFAVNVCDFGGAVGESWKIVWCFGLKGVAVADSDWDEDDWGSGGAERRFHLGKEDGGGDLIKDDCDKYDDNDCDDCGDNTSCNVSIIYFENFMFLFSVRWRYLYNTVPFLENYLAKSSLGLGAWKSFFFIFCNSLSDNHWSH